GCAATSPAQWTSRRPGPCRGGSGARVLPGLAVPGPFPAVPAPGARLPPASCQPRGGGSWIRRPSPTGPGGASGKIPDIGNRGPAPAGWPGGMRQALPVAVPASDAWQGRVPWHWLCACLGLVLYVPLLWGMDRWVLGVAASAYRTPAAMLLNAAVAVPFVLVLWSLSRRLLSSLLLVLLLQVLLYKVSAVKLQVLGAPLARQDFYFLTSFNRASLELLGSYLEDAAAVWAWTG